MHSVFVTSTNAYAGLLTTLSVTGVGDEDLETF